MKEITPAELRDTRREVQALVREARAFLAVERRLRERAELRLSPRVTGRLYPHLLSARREVEALVEALDEAVREARRRAELESQPPLLSGELQGGSK